MIFIVKSIFRDLLNFFLLFFNGKKIKISPNVNIAGSKFEGKNVLNANTIFANSVLGICSYIGSDCSFVDTKIGRFCSIGNRVKIVSSVHPSKGYVSTHPSFFSLGNQAGFTFAEFQSFKEIKYLDSNKRLSVIIGNDVWIGDEVMIMGGVQIHDGAIIGAKALVTKDVLPYTIVGGVPAKIIDYRFEKDEIDFLLKFKWWNKDINWISSNYQSFHDIKKFMVLFKI
jgi:acetyltransferase-like isoleucine patch superfamily enzyme